MREGLRSKGEAESETWYNPVLCISVVIISLFRPRHHFRLRLARGAGKAPAIA